MHFVIFNESDMAGHSVVSGQGIDLVDKVLPVFIGWVSFPGENDLHGTPLIEHHRSDAIQVMKNQRSSFIAGKTPGKSDRESVRIQQSSHCDDLPRIDSVERPAFTRFFAGKRQEFSFQ